MRFTRARSGLTTIFRSTHEPMTVGELLMKLKNKHIVVNKTTVYRQLDSLRDSNFIKQITFGDGKTRYEIVEDLCHHHVVCRKCGKVEDVLIKERSLISSIERQSKYLIDNHSIEFIGLCNSCK